MSASSSKPAVAKVPFTDPLAEPWYSCDGYDEDGAPVSLAWHRSWREAMARANVLALPPAVAHAELVRTLRELAAAGVVEFVVEPTC
ncbi:hypothetical protein ABRQ22_06760 [Cellulosimicrobium sp. ES-005]|uniref:Uncharacterized protein n=1 Tax=Cellulosimicrobium sp. ES-005 TaxID=3163031 RepID=A0AAU8G5P9_9MICO